jgi:pilus assembly protein CpaE
LETTIHILVVGNDPNLVGEFNSALAGVPNWRAVVHQVSGYPQAIEFTLSRHPQLICVQMAGDNGELLTFAREVPRQAGRPVIVALYKPDHTAPELYEGEQIIEVLRAGVRDFLRRPVSSTELRSVFDRLFQPRSERSRSSGRILSFISNKGGVGKSTLAVSTACALAVRHPGRVLLVDASLQLGVCALMLDLIPPTTITDAVQERDRLDETLLRRLAVAHPCGLHLLAAPADALEAAEIDDASIARVLNVAKREFDYVVVDTFPLLDGIVLSILDATDVSYVVMQGLAPNVVGVARFLPVLEGVGFSKERLHVILNQNYQRFAGNLDSRDIESRIGRTIDYIFPYQKQLLTATNTGQPYILKASRWFRFARTVAELVNDIESSQESRQAGGHARTEEAGSSNYQTAKAST